MKPNVNIFPFKIIFRRKYVLIFLIIIFSLSQNIYNNKHYVDYL